MIDWLQSHHLSVYSIAALIFLARITDVTIGTVRVIMIMRGRKYLAPLLGFIEILIWALAIGQLMQNLTNIFCYLAYAGGFAAGNFMGIYLEEKLALGIVAIRLITHRDSSKLIEHLKESPYGVTSIDAVGKKGKVSILFMIIKRGSLEDVLDIIEEHSPDSFYSVEDVRTASSRVFPRRSSLFPRVLLNPLRALRKGK